MIVEFTMYYAQCDRCGKVPTDEEEHSAFATPKEAEDIALDDYDWHKAGDKIYCPDCWDNNILKSV